MMSVATGRKPRPGFGLLALRAVLACLLAVRPVTASPYPRDDQHDLGFSFLMPRDCGTYCGPSQTCCNVGEGCFTSSGQAFCSTTAAGAVPIGTTTWTETKTYTSTIYSNVPVPAPTQWTQDCVPDMTKGEKACGPICCTNVQYCMSRGHCGEGSGNQGSGVVPGSLPPQPSGLTTQFSAPFRVTSGTVTTAFGTPATVMTTGTGAAVPSNGGGGGGGLSGGAIAGIVVGVLAGLILLFICCACCIIRGVWNTIRGLLGFGRSRSRSRSRERETEIVEERYHRHGSVHSGRTEHRTWFGGRPSSAGDRREKRSSHAGWWGLAALVGTVALLLGLRRDKKKDKKSNKTRSDYSSGYTGTYTSSDPSKLSPLIILPLDLIY